MPFHYNEDKSLIEISREVIELQNLRDVRRNPKMRATPTHRHGIALCAYNRDSGAAAYRGNSDILLDVYFQNIKDLLASFFIKYHYEIEMNVEWRKKCVGVVSGGVASMTKHMPILDYDGKGVKKKLTKEVKQLQEAFGLGPAHLYKTKRGFHVYFPTDRVGVGAFHKILATSSCCEGFKQAFEKSGYAVLRFSAKYTDFDIKKVGVIRPKNKEIKRVHIQGAVAMRLLSLSEECGTHIASLYPQWCKFTQDEKIWRARNKEKKVQPAEEIAKTLLKELRAKPVYSTSTSTWTSTATGQFHMTAPDLDYFLKSDIVTKETKNG